MGFIFHVSTKIIHILGFIFFQLSFYMGISKLPCISAFIFFSALLWDRSYSAVLSLVLPGPRGLCLARFLMKMIWKGLHACHCLQIKGCRWKQRAQGEERNEKLDHTVYFISIL